MANNMKNPNIIKLILQNNDFSIDDFLRNSSYDEMAEIDLCRDELIMHYHVDGKYYAPVFDGTYSHLFEFTIHNIVHPDDVVIYKELMNPITLLQSLEESPTPNFKRAELRYKLQDGSYRWVEQFVLTGKENNLREGVVRLYITDIHNRKMREQGSVANDSNVFYQERDHLTRLYLEKNFFNHAKEKVKEKPDLNWCFISIDIEHFRLFDEWYGRTAGDLLVAHIGIVLNEIEEKYDGIGGFFGQDDFALLMPYDERVIDKIFEDIRSFTISFGSSVGFMPAFGVCFIDNEKNIMESFNHASVACFYAKGDVKKRIYIYEAKMHSKSEQEYYILVNFIEALKKNEITFHIQPQYRINSKKIVGGESLARWSLNGEMISPAIFVPILEKYGFITDLDKYIWEEVCKYMKLWIDKGHKPVPISVNVSRIDIFTIDVPAFFNKLIRKYNLTSDLLKIEITESAYTDEESEVRDVVRKLRALGFIVIMDDFGSGYSSLNMLSNLNLDVIKLDAKFLNIDKSQKGIQILETIINMTKIIGVPVVVEGVETKEQCDFLEGLGCRYVQGYYFSKPIPREEFEALIINEDNIDDRGFVVKLNQQLSIREFLDKNIYSDSMLNNIIGSVAFYSWHGEEVDIIRYNQQFYESVGTPDFEERLLGIQKFLPDEDVPKIYKTLEEAYNNHLNGARGLFRFSRLDGTYSWFMLHFYYIGMQGEEKRFYGSAQNLTEYAELRQQMDLIAKFSSDSIIFLKIVNYEWIYKVASHGLENVLGLSK
ncbi:MAG: GGDEF domain-containing protein, partial [Bacilli bacterium]|nr:GGDEF domain-containing protein [Bacilli bacterium]